ncbi:MAG: Ig-like domain-containing protein, partial [Lachnospiraceae bacterium]|nr:Ig-like domain-containing protein [Lachnospiraceae bacterium]
VDASSDWNIGNGESIPLITDFTIAAASAASQPAYTAMVSAAASAGYGRIIAYAGEEENVIGEGLTIVVSSMAVTPASLFLKPGDSLLLSTAIYPVSDERKPEDYTYTWSVSEGSSKVVEIDETGLLKALDIGTATVEVQAEPVSGSSLPPLKAQAEVSVNSYVFEKSAYLLRSLSDPTDTVLLNVPENANVSYRITRGTEIAYVDSATGALTGKAAGVATLRATITLPEGTEYAEARVYVIAPSLSAKELFLRRKGENLSYYKRVSIVTGLSQAESDAMLSDIPGLSSEWSAGSSFTSLNGSAPLFRTAEAGTADGTDTYTARLSADGATLFEGSFTVSVLSPSAVKENFYIPIGVGKAYKALRAEEFFQDYTTDYTISSSDNAVALVNGEEIRLLSMGKAELTLYRGGTLFASATVNVLDPAFSRTYINYPGALEEADFGISLNGLGSLPAQRGFRVTWSSTNKTVADLANSGTDLVANTIHIPKNENKEGVSVIMAEVAEIPDLGFPGVTLTCQVSTYSLVFESGNTVPRATMGAYLLEAGKDLTLTLNKAQECTITLEKENPDAAPTVTINNGTKTLKGSFSLSGAEPGKYVAQAVGSEGEVLARAEIYALEAVLTDEYMNPLDSDEIKELVNNTSAATGYFYGLLNGYHTDLSRDLEVSPAWEEDGAFSAKYHANWRPLAIDISTESMKDGFVSMKAEAVPGKGNSYGILTMDFALRTMDGGDFVLSTACSEVLVNKAKLEGISLAAKDGSFVLYNASGNNEAILTATPADGVALNEKGQPDVLFEVNNGKAEPADGAMRTVLSPSAWGETVRLSVSAGDASGQNPSRMRTTENFTVYRIKVGRIAFPPEGLTLFAGEEGSLLPSAADGSGNVYEASDFNWTEDTEEAAIKVNAGGVVSALTAPKTGFGYVTATAKDSPEISASFRVTIKNIPATTIKVLDANGAASGPVDIGDSIELFATLQPDTSDEDVLWSVGNNKVASISGSGRSISVRGISVGSTAIRAASKLNDKVSGFYVVTVKKVDSASMDLYYSEEENGKQTKIEGTSGISGAQGEAAFLSAKLFPNEAEQGVKWFSGDKRVATVSPSGQLLFQGTGVRRSATITALAKDGTGVMASFPVAVTPKPQSISLSMPRVAVGLNASSPVTLEARVLPADASSLEMSVELTPSGIAFVEMEPVLDANGKIEHYQVSITGSQSGSTVAKFFSADKEVSVTLPITVGKAAKTVSLSSLALANNRLTLALGAVRKLAYAAKPDKFSNISFDWSSDNQAVAAVDSEGKVYALSPGTATITLRAGGYTAKCAVTVEDAKKVSQIYVTQPSLKLNAPAYGNDGGSQILYYSVSPMDGEDDPIVNWSSSTPGIQVRPVGENALKITALGATSGEVTGTALDGGGGKATIQVDIKSTMDWEDASIYADVYQEDTDGEPRPTLWLGHMEGAERDSKGIFHFTYTGSAIKPSPKVYFGTTLLTLGTDYSLSYKNNTNASSDTNPATLTVTGKGQYASKRAFSFFIDKASLDDYGEEETGFAIYNLVIKPTDQYDPLVMYNGKAVAKSNYKAEPASIPGSDNHWITITMLNSSLNFTGKTVVLGQVGQVDSKKRLVDEDGKEYRKLSDMTISLKGSSFTYTGSEIRPDFALVYKDKTTKSTTTVLDTSRKNDQVDVSTEFTNGEFSWVYTDNVNAGVAKLTVFAPEGSGRYTGAKTVSFKITKKNLGDVSASASDSLAFYADGVKDPMPSAFRPEYTKSGVKPEVGIVRTYGEEEFSLAEGKDFKVSYSYGDGKSNVTMKITGTGNYTGTRTMGAFTMANADLSEMSVFASDFVYSPKAYAFQKTKIQVFDQEGTALKYGTDYTYDYKSFASRAFTGEAATPGAGSYVSVTLTGRGKYSGTHTACFRIVEKSQSIDSGTFKVEDQTYSGLPIALFENKTAAGKIGIYQHSIKNTSLNLDVDYEIACYQNNVKSGTAKVCLRGIGAYGGSKIVSFRIKKRDV